MTPSVLLFTLHLFTQTLPAETQPRDTAAERRVRRSQAGLREGHQHGKQHQPPTLDQRREASPCALSFDVTYQSSALNHYGLQRHCRCPAPPTAPKQHAPLHHQISSLSSTVPSALGLILGGIIMAAMFYCIPVWTWACLLKVGGWNHSSRILWTGQPIRHYTWVTT